MTRNKPDRWHGLSPEAQAALAVRDYGVPSLAQRISEVGIEAGQLAAANRAEPEIAQAWIPGVEIFRRTVHPQRHRGLFGEFARRDEGTLAKIGLWPQQWSAARMFTQTAKGFHIHPPSVPEETPPNEWFRHLLKYSMIGLSASTISPSVALPAMIVRN